MMLTCTSIKRPGRPRKEHSQHMFDGLDIGSRSQAVTRATRKPVMDSTTIPRKRKANDDEDTPQANGEPNAAMQNLSEASKPMKDASAVQVFHSPEAVSRTAMHHEGSDAKGSTAALVGNVAVRSGPPPAKRRRVIQQFDDMP